LRKLIPTLVLGDARSILRESTLVLALFGPIAIFGLLLSLPFIEQLIQDRLDFDLGVYRLFIACFLSLIPSMLFGMVYGFIMLDERDEDIISFISITPMQKKGYLTYKLQIPMFLSSGLFLLYIYSSSLINLAPLHTPFVVIMIALEAVIGTLFLVAFADNKVEGLAFGKLMGLMYLSVPAVFLWDSPWHWLTAWLPPFWVAKAVLHSSQGSSMVWGDVAFGLLVHFGFIQLFLRIFLNRQK